MADSAQTTQIIFPFKDIAAALVKLQGLHEGIWGIYLEFGIQGTNAGPTPTELVPAAIVPVVKIGLQKFTEETTLSVDAAKVNPMPVAEVP